MKLHRNFARIATVGLLAFTLAGCATHYDRKTSNTLLGAGLGGATGAVLSGGDPVNPTAMARETSVVARS